MSTNKNLPQPIAIVGSACRFPGQSTSPSKLYELLRQPRDVRREFDPEVLNLKRFYDSNPDAPGSTNVKPKGYLLADDTRTFDASFFNISPYEAESMDPQLRVMLETVYEAFESAGYTLDQMRGSQTSVHVGVMTSDYYDILTRDPETVPLYAGTGVTRSILSNRISYTFDLHGPSVTLDTACSSSLVALHQAVQGLQTGDATCAVVCGINLIFDPMLYVMLSKLHMLSPDSQSRMWDKTVNGYARGEGSGCVVLKPLDQAIHDGDSIEGIIRGSGVNSDGQSMGLTMPTVEAQAALIRDVYKRAGLDPIKDRCQYFECHGTGTPVGDPVESRAIYEAMIQGGEALGMEQKDPLYVGSIKTIIGHLEGGAGLAGVLKALLSIKHKTIFPNLLFDELNPAIKPYYDGFKVPTSPTPWPELPAGTPRRVSVNSFGFGGTNAHAIIESYEPKQASKASEMAQSSKATLSPFTLSANIASSLVGNAQSLLSYLNENPSIDLTDLSWVLQNRRSAHRVRTFFTAQSREALIQKLAKFIEQHRKSNGKDEIGIRARPADPLKNQRILGIFTGQGAQWPTMGRDLLSKSPVFRRVIEECDEILRALPDGPEWSLTEELSKDAATSRVAEAVISQPICTAIQLGLVEMLRESGVYFDSVVGHSSGEIAAAYACGIISAAAALQVAYYRGKCAHMARGTNGQTGAMLAVGVSYDSAAAFCKRAEYQGRLCVAASNAPQSVTLSGDLDAVIEAKMHFDQNGTFARQLKVDTAYHSHHMNRCVETYLRSLEACNIAVHPPKGNCLWISSVRGNAALFGDELESLKGSYWVENMVQTVLFCPAIQSAVRLGGPYDLSIEVGPNPTLRGPTQQTLELAQGGVPPHIGTLKRDAPDVESLGDTIGTIWCHLGPAFINFDGFRQAFNAGPVKTSKLLKDLPVYAWDHDRVYWSESRISKNYRNRDDIRHPLLGRRVSDDTEQIMRWRNVLKIADLPWTQGHVVSGEVLLPGTSYVAMSCEAAKYIAGGNTIRRIEMENIKIHRAVIVPDSREGLETTFTVHLEESKDSSYIAGDFSYHFSDKHLGSMVHACTGKIVVHLGEASDHELPTFQPTGLTLYPIDTDTSYDVISQNGFMYSGPFRRLEDIQRKLNYSVAQAEWSLDELSGGYILHPAVMDVSWQCLFTACADPRAGKLPTAILPVGIKRVIVNPNLTLGRDTIKTRNESFITARKGVAIIGDVHIYDAVSGNAAVQMESVSLEPIAPPSEDQDRQMFFDTIYKTDPSLQLVEPVHDHDEAQKVRELSSDIERVCLVYVQHVLKELKPIERPGLEWFHKRLITAFENYVKSIRGGRHPVAQKAWLDDSPDVLETIYAKWPGVVDLEVVRVCGENMLGTLRKTTSLLELMREGDLSTRLYSDGCGLAQANQGMTHVLEQISHKFPLAKYVEIGAGTGSTTNTILTTIGNTFQSYTFTDISPAFFGDAADRFSDFRSKMIFKTLDAEKDVTPQGFEKHAYDVVVASNVLHATAQLKKTLEHARSLLKPGGFLLLIEITGIEIIRTTFCVGGLPGWWLGADEGRDLHPGMSTEQWDSKLQETGFSGVDLVFHDIPDAKQHTMSFIASQAVDNTIQLLREPFECLAEGPEMKSLLVVGGKTLPVSKAVTALKRLLGPAHSSHITVASDVEEIDFSRIGSRVDVICLQELDGSLFAQEMTPKRLKALQTMIVTARNVVWVTTGRRTENPHANMMVGMARAISKELPHVRLQFLDLDSISSPTSVARTTLQTFLRMHILASHDHNNSPLLWPQEPELLVEGTDTLIPRLRPDKPLNDRYNAKFRVVSKSVNSSDASFCFTRQREKLALMESLSDSFSNNSDHVSVRVQYSFFVPCEQGQQICLSMGRLITSNALVITVSDRNTSIINVPQENIVLIDEKDCSPAVLETIVNQIAMIGLFNLTENGGSALLHNPTANMATAFTAEARKHGIEPLCASSQNPVPQGWINIHPQSPARVLRYLLPQDIKIYLDASTSTDLESTSIASALPTSCKLYQWGSSLIKAGLSSATSIKNAIEAAYKNLPTQVNAVRPNVNVLDIEETANTNASILDRTHIVNWESTNALKLIVQPPDMTVLFDSAKTHLMIGMAGGLGLSVCGWALQHGVKEMVITSRKPQINPDWLSQARNQGAKVHVRSLDASDRTALEYLVSDVRNTLPPLGGVCNAAMVLSDKLFVDMDVGAISDTFKPKVDVSNYLDEILADTPLDYFVMFSSALSLIGGQGSSNYHAANLYMAGLAAQRRQSGRPGSVIHIGYVTDVGYFMRVDQSSRDYIGRMQIVPLSETDVHHAFAEALRAGKPDSQRSCEVGLGIEPLNVIIEDQEPVWATDSLFAHFLPSTNNNDKTSGIQFGRDDIKKVIQDAETETEVVEIVQEALCAKIETMLQLPTGSVDANALLTELGIDSLVAVEIRAWFSKKVGIDVPVVKILGRSSLLQICLDATEEINATKADRAPTTTQSELETSSDSQNLSDSSDAEAQRSGTVSPPSTEGESVELSHEKIETVSTTAQEGPKIESKAVAEPAEPIPGFYQSLIHSGRMSAAQSRIYVLNHLMNDPTAYSLMIRYDIEEDLDVKRLENALTTTMQHHESLRTCYFTHEEDDQPTQGLLSFPVRHFKHISDATDQDIAEELHAIRTKVWDIEHGETLNLTVLSRDARRHILILGYHHIILDASGMRRFIEDLNIAYNRRTLKMLGGTCIDFAEREQESLRSGALEKNFQYWREQFNPLPELLPLLPMAKTTVRPETKQIFSVHASREIDEDSVVKVKQMCQVLGITAFQFHLAVVQVLLAQLLGLDDLCIGVADANRPDTDFMDTVGFFLNLLPVRFHLPNGTTFAEVAQNTARQMGAAFENSVPFDMLLDQLNIARSSSHTPLFQVLVNYRLAMTQSIPFGNSHLHIVDGEEGRNPYDITFSFLESHSKGLGITMDCLDTLYDIAGIESVLDMYLDLLKEILRDINIPISSCQVYRAEAVSAALDLGSGGHKDVVGPVTLSEKFLVAQQDFKERLAIQDRSSKMTYSQLLGNVRSVAAAILAAGHTAGSRIAVLCEPSTDFVTSLLAIIYIGAIYVPLDTSLPSSRHAEIISSSDPSLIICHQGTNELASQLVGERTPSLPVLYLDSVEATYDPVPCSAQADSPAFLLYTSGTTGKPKGVMLSQGNVVNWLAHAIPKYKLDTGPAVVLQQSSYGFDMSLIQIFCALISGGSLIIVPQDIRKDPPQIANMILEHNVNWTFGVPSEYLLWLRYGRESLRRCRGWRAAWMGGEVFPAQLKRELKRLELSDFYVSDNYGPTEVTFTATSQPISLDVETTVASGSPIGKPHPNYAICILDMSGHPVPQGFRGEICIGGGGIAKGYWNMSVETNKKFIKNPAASIGNRQATTSWWYRTGDQGKLASDGTVIFLGRLGGDTQVKLRGQRIELAEVEGALLKSGESMLSAAVVTVRDGDLVAHIVPSSGKHIDRDVIQGKLLTRLHLPQYMHPSRIIIVSDLPRSSSGKIDRQAVLKLPLSTNIVDNDDVNAGTSDLTLREHELKVLWSRVLPDPYQKLTANSDFFLEGGNSLRLTKLQNEIKETLGVSVTIRELYSTPTLRQMAARIGSESLSDNDIDWSIETAIPDDLIAASRETAEIARTPKTTNLEVLLTGVAAVLGNYILHHLLEDDSVAKIHCIAVSSEDEERIPVSHKIQTYFGSLASDKLGLNESEVETLKSNMDVVIHAGANGHCLNSYSSIRRPNVESTQFLASLCVPRSIPFLYLSSQRVPAMAGLKVLPPVPVLAEPAKTGDTGYMASRWVSERFLHKFSEHNSFLTEIHRPCLFFGNRAPPSDALNGVLRYTRLMRAVPNFTKVEGYVDIKEADEIARDLVSSAIAMAGSSSTGVRFRHHSSGRKVTLEEWPGYMSELTGDKFEVLELPDWISRARKAGIHPLIATYLEGVIEKEELGLFPYLGESA